MNSDFRQKHGRKKRPIEEQLSILGSSVGDKHAEFHVFVFNSHLLTCHNSDNNTGLEEVKRRVAGNNSLS